MTKPLRIGFDLDGVLLYNPVRTARLPVSIIKQLISPKKQLKFIIPKDPFSKFLWHAAHWTSLFIQPGYKELTELMKKGKIEGYLISARYDFLSDDFERWKKKLKTDGTFTGVYMNLKNEQPHHFKTRMVKELDLDIFVEDNLDIVRSLSKETRAKVFWIYNLFDRATDYPYKFPDLKRAIAQIEKLL